MSLTTTDSSKNRDKSIILTESNTYQVFLGDTYIVPDFLVCELEAPATDVNEPGNKLQLRVG
jgi:hypothetical protein